MKRLLVLWILFAEVMLCAAQNFRGKVTDEQGASVPFASLYLKERQTGLTTDDNGCFQASLPPGRYTCDVSSIGFVRQTFSFQISDGEVEKSIVLSEQVYALDEVSIVRGEENPAYSIMRQAIARAPFFRTQVKGFTAGTYLKGTGKLTSIPAVLKLSKEVREESKKSLGELFVLEEQREVSFKAPNTWKNRVKAYRNSFPDNINVEIGLHNVNFYEPTLFGCVSPLSRNAFAYYDFRFEGCYPEGDRVISKIRVIPRKVNPSLLEGDLFIAEELWSVVAGNFSFRAGGMKATVKVTCKEVRPSVYLPASTSMVSSFNLLGFKAEASYLAAVHYTQVEVGSWQPLVGGQTTPLSGKAGKWNRQMETLVAKNDLTLNDAYKLSRLMEKMARENDSLRTKRTTYELPSRTHREKEEHDSLATGRDSLYWASVRSVPLRPEEIRSYLHKEKATLRLDSVKVAGGEKKASATKQVLDAFTWGRSFRTSDKKGWISLPGLVGYVPQYNFVDGFWLGMRLKSGVQLSESTSLQLIPSVYYTSARHSWVGKGELLLDYAPRRRGQWSLSGGVLSTDFNEKSGESVLINSLSTALFGRNDVKLFEKRFLTVAHQIELANGLLFASSLSWERRRMLENHLSKSWFGKQAQPNVPREFSFVPMPENELLKASFLLEYTPAHYYRMSHGKKVYEPSRYPTFRIGYDRTFPLHRARIAPSYHHIAFAAQQQVELDVFNRLRWSVGAGTFWNQARMQFPDYHFFASTRFPLTGRSLDEGFSLLDNYAYATADRWARAHLSWYTPYLLVKQLPFLRNKLFDEALHVRLLATYNRSPYTEAGYSVGISALGCIGVFVGFERLKYRSTGISVSLPLNLF